MLTRTQKEKGIGGLTNKGMEFLHGQFHFKVFPDSTVNRTKVICNHCKVEFRQTTLDAVCGRSIDKQKQEKLTNGIAKWIAIACRPISVVEDVSLKNVLRIATNDGSYEIPSRCTIPRRIHELYEKERTAKTMTLQRAPSVALTGDYWTSLGNHNYLGVRVLYIDEQRELHSRALTVMKTEERHFAETCTGHFIQVAQQWNVSNKVTTLSTDTARNMIAAARHLPFEHVPCFVSSVLSQYLCITVHLTMSWPSGEKLWGTLNTVQQMLRNWSNNKLDKRSHLYKTFQPDGIQLWA